MEQLLFTLLTFFAFAISGIAEAATMKSSVSSMEIPNKNGDDEIPVNREENGAHVKHG